MGQRKKDPKIISVIHLQLLKSIVHKKFLIQQNGQFNQLANINNKETSTRQHLEWKCEYPTLVFWKVIQINKPLK